jgi:hypothetical protein
MPSGRVGGEGKLGIGGTPYLLVETSMAQWE